MTLRTLAHELQRIDTRSNMSLRTKVPKSEIDDRGLFIMPRLRGSGLSAGDHILVQVMNDDYSAVLHEADFVITSAVIKREQVVDDDRHERTSVETVYRIQRKGEWWDAPGVNANAGAAPSPKTAKVAA